MIKAGQEKLATSSIFPQITNASISTVMLVEKNLIDIFLK